MHEFTYDVIITSSPICFLSSTGQSPQAKWRFIMTYKLLLLSLLLLFGPSLINLFHFIQNELLIVGRSDWIIFYYSSMHICFYSLISWPLSLMPDRNAKSKKRFRCRVKATYSMRQLQLKIHSQNCIWYVCGNISHHITFWSNTDCSNRPKKRRGKTKSTNAIFPKTCQRL